MTFAAFGLGDKRYGDPRFNRASLSYNQRLMNLLAPFIARPLIAVMELVDLMKSKGATAIIPEVGADEAAEHGIDLAVDPFVAALVVKISEQLASSGKEREREAGHAPPTAVAVWKLCGMICMKIPLLMTTGWHWRMNLLANSYQIVQCCFFCLIFPFNTLRGQPLNLTKTIHRVV